jgi:uncharacterized protein YunC (DUF1805 family)
MEPVIIDLGVKTAQGYVVPLGPVNLVFALTATGMAGCGAFDVLALDKYDYPAVKIGACAAGPIATVERLLAGIVKESNQTALKKGIQPGMNCEKALAIL